MENPQPAQPNLSPDGRFWWDGVAWQPVAPAPVRPATVTSPRLPYVQPQESPPERAAGTRERRSLFWLLGALVLGAIVGGLLGSAGAAIVASGRGPTAPPAFGAGFPGNDRRSLPGLSAAAIQQWLKKEHHWQCQPPEDIGQAENGASKRMDCSAPGDAGDALSIRLEYADDTHIVEVQGACRLQPGAAVCKEMFGDLAYEILAGQPDQRRQARDWAVKNVDSDTSTNIGDVLLMASLEPHILYFTPAA